MKIGTFVTEVGEGYQLTIPVELRERLELMPGDRVEISVKKIKSRKIDLFLADNPLYRLLKLKTSPSGGEG